MGNRLAERLPWKHPEPPGSFHDGPVNVLMSETFFSRRRSPASLQTPAVVFVCLGRRVGISKTRFSAEDMRRIGSLFAICRLRYREPTGRPSRKCIVQRCGGMNV